MKIISIIPITERCFKITARDKYNLYSVMTSNISLIERVGMNERQAKKELKRMIKFVGEIKQLERPKVKFRIILPFLAILGLYVCSYPTQCNSLQIWGYIMGLIALVGLGVIVYKYSE